MWITLYSLTMLGLYLVAGPIPPFGFLFYFFLSGTLSYWIHRVGHWKTGWKTWYQAHMVGHHVAAYPVVQFQHSKYIDNQDDPWHLNSVLYIGTVCLLALLIGWWIHLSPFTTFRLALSGVIGLWMEDLLHSHIHLSQSPLQCYDWFRDLQEIHKEHHRWPTRANFAVFGLWTDALFGTLRTKTVS